MHKIRNTTDDIRYFLIYLSYLISLNSNIIDFFSSSLPGNNKATADEGYSAPFKTHNAFKTSR